MARHRATAKFAAAACVVIAVLVLFGVPQAWASFGERFALVIGNSDYAHVEQLPNTARDAEAMADALEALQFTVFKGIDLTSEDFERLIEDFDAAAADADTVVFYYAGHGFQLDGLNHLAPVDAVLRDRSQIEAETLVLNDVIERIHRRQRQTIVFLDACRNNPLPPGSQAGSGAGLAQVGTGDGTFIAFATQPGNVSYDGTGKNSPFTEALLTHIGKPGRSISSLMIEVRNDVSDRTLGRQVPWDQSSLRADFVFNPSPEYVAMSTPSAGGIVIGRPTESTVRGRSDDVAEDPEPRDASGGEAVALADPTISAPAVQEDPASAPPRQRPTSSITLGPAPKPQPVIEPATAAAAPQRLKPDREWYPDDEEPEVEDAAVEDAGPGEEQQMAALDPQQPLAPEPPEEPQQLVDPEELARSLQSELARLGCYRLGIDGDWGPGSRSALESFYREKGQSPPSLEPSTDLEAMLQGESGTVCAPPKRSPPKKQRVATPPPPKKTAPTRRARQKAAPAPTARQSQPTASPSLPRLLQ